MTPLAYTDSQQIEEIVDSFDDQFCIDMFDQAVEIYENLDDLLASIRAD
jgi:hypothetical protein